MSLTDFSGISSIPLQTVTLVMPVHSENAPSPIDVTLSGIVMLTMLSHS